MWKRKEKGVKKKWFSESAVKKNVGKENMNHYSARATYGGTGGVNRVHPRGRGGREGGGWEGQRRMITHNGLREEKEMKCASHFPTILKFSTRLPSRRAS